MVATCTRRGDRHDRARRQASPGRQGRQAPRDRLALRPRPRIRALDSEIEREINERVLFEGFWLRPGTATVKVRRGEVVLVGTVESETDAEVLPKYIRRVPGVVSVTSRWRCDLRTDLGSTERRPPSSKSRALLRSSQEDYAAILRLSGAVASLRWDTSSTWFPLILGGTPDVPSRALREAGDEEGGEVMTIVRWSPFPDIEAIDRRFRRMFDEFGIAPPHYRRPTSTRPTRNTRSSSRYRASRRRSSRSR